MKLQNTLAIAIIVATILPASADSKRTAEFILSDPKAYQDQEVTLDVAMVMPVRWISPLPEIAFFHALTTDRTDKKRGGGILVAVPSGDSAKFAKKYGTDFDKGSYTTLRGTLIAAEGREVKHRGVWVVDTTGKLDALIKERKVAIPGNDGDKPGKGRPGNE